MSDHQDENQNTDKQDVDAHSGVETTGHEWDGIKELNNPLPRWWLWVFYVTIIWSIWYWVIYPAWPTISGNTEGTGGYTQFKELEDSQAEIVARQKVYLDRFEQASFQDILDNPELYAFAMAGGKAMFKDNCATCHGTGAQGFKGYPNLNDDDWLWGGALSDIHQTIQYGIRENNLDTRLSQMPAFGKDGMLKNDEIEAVVDYVFSLSGQAAGHGGDHDLTKGQTIFAEQCASCHGTGGKGDREFGAPNLTDKIWLYGGDRDSVFETVYSSRSGMMPAWKNRLDKNTIRQLTIYLHQLGGGEEEREDGQEETVEDIPGATHSE